MTRDCKDTILWNRNEFGHQTTTPIPTGDQTLYPTSGNELVKIFILLRAFTFKRIKVKGECSVQIKLVMSVRSKSNGFLLIQTHELKYYYQIKSNDHFIPVTILK